MSSHDSDTRSRILKAAWKLLEEGSSAVRVSDIAKETGISRQALYLHFPNRAELLIATTRYVDEVNDVNSLLEPSREATDGKVRLIAFVGAWAAYIPKIHGVASALIAMQDNDEAARKAWADRMAAIRHGCAAAVDALMDDAQLQKHLGREEAIDVLSMLLTVENWQHLRHNCGWSQSQYLNLMKQMAMQSLVSK